MKDTNSLSHTKWECKYHVVSIPKYRRGKLFEEVRRELGPVLRELAQSVERSRYYSYRDLAVASCQRGAFEEARTYLQTALQAAVRRRTVRGVTSQEPPVADADRRH